MSITSINTYINKKIYNVKALNSAEFGEEDFLDNILEINLIIINKWYPKRIWSKYV